jgi:hypothetical protein
LPPFLVWANTSIINWGYLFIHLSYSLDEVPPKFNFFFAMSQFDCPITEDKTETMEALQNRRFKVWIASPFAVGERRTTFVKMLLGTCQELGNSLL